MSKWIPGEEIDKHQMRTSAAMLWEEQRGVIYTLFKSEMICPDWTQGRELNTDRGPPDEHSEPW
jgi:hypothetical protein